MDQQRSGGWEGIRKWPESPGVGQAEEEPPSLVTLSGLCCQGSPPKYNRGRCAAGSGTACELAWSQWAGKLATVSHTVPATQKAEGSLDRQNSKGTVPTSIPTQEWRQTS